MKRMITMLVVGAAVSGSLLLVPVEAKSALCPPDSVKSGPTCMDKYEASMWRIPPTNPAGGSNALLIRRIPLGKTTAAALTAAGATRLGESSDNYAPCNDNGSNCTDVYAVSIAGVTPAASINWFQAAAAARNSRKRLPTNQEWQAGALGTPDTGGADDGVTTCNSDNLAPGVTATGSRSACVSDVGAFDMVGNLVEWVADWVPLTPISVTPLFAGDQNVTGVVVVNDGPAALLRGGQFTDFTTAGVFAVYGSNRPSASGALIGFRAAR